MNERPAYVYLFTAPGCPFMKIGSTYNPTRREKELRQGTVEELWRPVRYSLAKGRIVAKVKCSSREDAYDMEGDIIRKFAWKSGLKRARGKREWFLKPKSPIKLFKETTQEIFDFWEEHES